MVRTRKGIYVGNQEVQRRYIGNKLIFENTVVVGINLLQKGNISRKGFVNYPDDTFLPNNMINMDDSLIPVKPGDYFTASGDLKEAWRFYYKNSSGETIDFLKQDTRFNNPEIFTIQVPNNENIVYMSVSYPAGEYMKLERGKIATEWSPAPEDIT